MSLHRSLKTKPTALNQHRNVLTRAERISKLTETERFKLDANSPLGLFKVGNRMAVAAKKEKKEATAEGEAGAAGATATPAAAGAAPVAGSGKPGAKGAAAPAAKPGAKAGGKK